MSLPFLYEDEQEAKRILKERGQERAQPVWKDRITEQAYLRSSRRPKTLVDLYESDELNTSLRTALTGDLYQQEAMQSINLKKSEFTAAVEAAYHENRGEIPLTFWMEFTPAELLDVGQDDAARWLEDALAAQQAEQAIQNEIDQRWEAALAAHNNRLATTEKGSSNWDFLAAVTGFSTTMDIINAVEGTSEAPTREFFENQVRGMGDLNFEDEIAAYMESERKLLNAIREGKRRPSGQDERVPDAMLERYGQDPYERFFLSNGDPLSSDDHARFWDSEMAWIESLGDVAGEEIDLTEVTDEEFEMILQAREEFLRQQVRGISNTSQLDKVLTPGRGPGFIEGALGEMGQVIEKGLQFGGFLIEHGGPLTWPMKNAVMPALSHFAGTAEEARDETLQEIKNQTGMVDKDKLAEYVNREANLAFRELEQADPEMHEEYMRMAGLDPTLALAFFQADLTQSISPEEQIRYLSDLQAEEDERIRELEAQDFTLGDDMLHILSAYGRNVPGRLSTWFTLMLTDEDIQGLASSGQWGEFFDQINRESEKFGHTPSAALGIDGSLSGLMLDLGSGIAFDPTTWIFGPRLGARVSAPATKSQAAALAKSGMKRKMVDDIIDFAHSPSRDATSVYQVADFLDPQSMGELLNVIDYSPAVLTKTPWRAVKGHKAMEVHVDFLQKLIPDEVRSTIDDVADLTDDMLKNGVSEPLEIMVSRGDDTVILTDGVKRVMAAEGNISHLPVRLRVSDDVSRGTIKVPGYTDDQVALMRRVLDEVPDEGTSNTALGIDSQRFQYNVVQERIRPDVDAQYGTIEHKGANYSVHKLEGKQSPSRPGVKPEEIWYALDENGELAAFYDSSHLIQAPGAKYKGLLHKVLDKSEEVGDSFLPRLAERATSKTSSFTEDGVRFTKNAINNRMGNALKQSERTGLPLSELLVEGESLKQVLKAAGKNADEVVRPDAVLPKRLLSQLDDSVRAQVNEIVDRAIMERGVTLTGSQYAAIARHTNAKLRKLFRSNNAGRWVQRYATPRNVGTRFDLVGPNAMDEIIQAAYTIWGDNAGKLNQWLEELMAYQKQVSAKNMYVVQRLAKLQPRQQRLQHMKDALGGNLYDDALKHLDDIDTSDHVALKARIAEEEKAIREAYVAIDKESSVIGATDQLEDIVQRMWQDYNREYIAKNPVWKDLVDPESGMVSWEQLGKGKIKSGEGVNLEDTRQFLPDDMIRAAEEMGVDAEALAQWLSHTQNAKLATQVPVSPLELLMARELGGAAYTRMTHWSLVSQVREAAYGLHRLWTIDKVFTPATAVTVSFDELLRAWHIQGITGVTRWAKDRALFMQARAQALIHGRKPVVREGAEFLSDRAQERLRVLNDYPTYLKQAERQTLEQHGWGWVDIEPGKHGYDDAARQWSAGLLQDSGFRAFLRGEDDFAKWFMGPDGERLRKSTVLQKDGTTSLVDDAAQFYQGWKTLFDDVVMGPAHKAGKYQEVRQAWMDVANKIDAEGGLPKDLPDIAINYLGPVRGVKRDIPNKLSISKLQEGFFDRLFMDPVNYRRGFLADLTRTHEKARLRSLVESQGKRIVSDAEMEAMLGLQGLSGASRTGLKGAIHEMALKSGIMPESYLDELVEKAVLREIDNTLYAFDASSRLGSQAKAVFPFGKPWADMAGFWGREIIRKPVLRGWINEKNALWLRSANEAGLLSAPLVPNRSAAMLSRLAHTDFTIDKGFHDGEGGLIPGSDETDFSPMFFLPTAGENPFSYMIPGLGIIPIAFLDWVMAEKYDPVDQPEEYQRLQDDLGQFIPSVHFQQGGVISRALGGGSLAKTGGMVVDIAGMIGNDSMFALTSWMGDISREIDRTREISALLADPEELQMLIDAKTPEEAELLLQAMAVTADRRASGTHLAESAIRYMVPASNRFAASLAEIQDVWLDAAQFDQLSHLVPGLDPDRMTDAQLRQAADDIRSGFFRLPAWQRDMLVVQQPSLAVNMVGSWEWTPKAINEALDGTDYAYRTGGSPSELARHEQLVKNGFIRPVQPIERARRILGVIDNAKKTAAKELWTEQLHQVNGLLWDAIPEEEKAKLEWVLGTDFADEWGLETVEEVWTNWRRIEEDLEFWLAEQEGVEPVRGESSRKEDETPFDRLRSAVSIPEEMKPWGVSFGLEEEDVSSRANEWTVYRVDEKSQRLAAALGIPISEGMTGENLFHEVQQIVAQRNSPIFDVVRPAYDRYIGDRSVNTGINKLYEARQSDLVDERFQERIDQFLFRDDLIKRRAEDTKITRKEQDEMRRLYEELVIGAAQQKTDWEGIWEEQFERSYGPLKWEPPVPREPFDTDGSLATGVTRPSVRHVVDGDTLLIQEYPGAPVLNSVRLLGVRAEEVNGPNQDEALRQENALKDAIMQGVQNGDSIYLVRDERFGDTDYYGRMLAWLWIGDEPYIFEEQFDPTQDPSGGEE